METIDKYIQKIIKHRNTMAEFRDVSDNLRILQNELCYLQDEIIEMQSVPDFDRNACERFLYNKINEYMNEFDDCIDCNIIKFDDIVIEKKIVDVKKISYAISIFRKLSGNMPTVLFSMYKNTCMYKYFDNVEKLDNYELYDIIEDLASARLIDDNNSYINIGMCVLNDDNINTICTFQIDSNGKVV